MLFLISFLGIDTVQSEERLTSPMIIEDFDLWQYAEGALLGKMAHVENTDFDVNYRITGGQVLGITVDVEAKSLLVSIQTTRDGVLTITLPRDLIDAQTHGEDAVFFVLIDGEETSDVSEETTSTDRTLTIHFQDGAEEIEIIGITILPVQEMEWIDENGQPFPEIYTNLDLKIRESSENHQIQVYPTYTDDSGNMLSFTVDGSDEFIKIYIDGKFVTTVEPNQWSDDIPVDADDYTIYAESPKIADIDNVVVYTAAISNTIDKQNEEITSTLNTNLDLELRAGSYRYYVQVYPTYTDDSGNMLSFTVDGSDEFIKIYIDGKFVTTVEPNQWSDDIYLPGSSPYEVYAKSPQVTMNQNGITYSSATSNIESISNDETGPYVEPDYTPVLFIVVIIIVIAIVIVIIMMKRKKPSTRDTQYSSFTVVNQEATAEEAAKQEAAKQEAAKQEAAKQEAAKQEAAKQEAAKQEAAKQEAAKQEAAKQEAAKQEPINRVFANQDFKKTWICPACKGNLEFQNNKQYCRNCNMHPS